MSKLIKIEALLEEWKACKGISIKENDKLTAKQFHGGIVALEQALAILKEPSNYVDSMDACKCDKSVMDGNLHRANSKGETPAIWACDDCHTEPISEGRQLILDAISECEPDFSGLREVDEESIESKLYQIIDDISTAGDMFKPELQAFEKYVFKKIEDANKLIVSDGYKLFYAENGSRTRQ